MKIQLTAYTLHLKAQQMIMVAEGALFCGAAFSMHPVLREAVIQLHAVILPDAEQVEATFVLLKPGAQIEGSNQPVQFEKIDSMQFPDGQLVYLFKVHRLHIESESQERRKEASEHSRD